MNIKSLAIFALLFSSASLFAQKTVDPSNTRVGESKEYCIQHKKLAELAQTHPELYAQYLEERSKDSETAPSSEKSGIVYTFPVVIHVLHQNGPENISMEQIQSAIDVLNVDYRLLNPDANSVHPDFIGLPADVEFQFALATKAPNGACFSGVTRTNTPLTFDGSDGQAQVNAVIAGNDVYQGQWPPNKYINVYVCEDIGGAQGYTFNPGSWSGSSMYFNGIFIEHNYFGDTGTSDVFSSRTLTHEVGHWFNLSHPWGDNNDPGVSCGTDNVADTPQTRGSTSCNLNENFCGPRANVENYMDYSFCSKMFTPGQATRMRNAATSTTAGRNNVSTSANLLATGAGVMTLCKADFNANKTSLCPGDQVQFTDMTYNAVSGWTWSFPGGSPASSTAQNPIVTYSTPGVYAVTLTATDGASSDGETKTNYITVLNAGGSLPFFDGFENYTTLDGINQWGVVNFGNNEKWAITTSAAHTGSKSVKLSNFNQASGNIDELVASSVNLAGQSASNTTFTFRYAYRKRITSNNEYLRVSFSNDCGATWSVKKTLPGSVLGSATSTTAWTPTSADWVTIHITNFASSNMVSDFRYKFGFESNGGNNIYLDDINIYAGPPSETIVLGVEENSILEDLSLFPNPSEDEINVRFNIANSQSLELITTDITGKVIETRLINAGAGANLILMDVANFAQGVYFLNLRSSGLNKTLQFVKN